MRAALAVLAAVPTLALAQVGALNAAREAGAKQQAGTAAHQRAADAHLAEGAEPVVPSAPEKADPADDGVDLNAAASRLEHEVGALPGTEVALSPAAAPSGEAHTVQRGDTLWDLSAKYLQDPFAWPKIWSWNPEIANPHWIYPGNVVRLGPAGGAAQVLAPAASAPADDAEPQAPAEIASFSVGSLDRPQELGNGDEVMIAGGRKIGYVAPAGTRTRRDSFVTPTELAQSGAISAAFEDKLLLTLHDRAYATFDGAAAAKPGQTYAIFRTERELRHPVTGKSFGYKTIILGAGRVVAVDGKQATVDITSAAEAIERGDRLGLLPAKPLAEVARRPNQKNVQGVIVASDIEVLSEIGQHHYVYVDRGSADGVEPGNVFTVVRSGDPYGRDMTAARQDPNLPPEQVGALLVVEAKEHASTALVVKSERELLVGDRVEMRTAVAAGGTAN